MPEELEAREAVRQAYQAFYRRLVAALYALTGDFAEAQDLVQEAYARALARPRVFLDVADPEAWLRTVAVNLARTRWRRRRLFDTLVRTGRVTRTPDSVPGADPNRVALVAALQQLSRPTREAIVLHHLADMSVYEVAEALGVPVGTVKARLSRGRNMLATLLSDRIDEQASAPRGGPAQTEPAQTEPALTEAARGEMARTEQARTETPRIEAPQIAAAQVAAAQIAAAQIGAAQIGAAQIGAAQIGATRIGAAQIEATPGGAARDATMPAGEPTVPARDAIVPAGVAPATASPAGTAARPVRAARAPDWGLGGSHG